jgi:hypothetical protein
MTTDSWKPARIGTAKHNISYPASSPNRLGLILDSGSIEGQFLFAKVRDWRLFGELYQGT